MRRIRQMIPKLLLVTLPLFLVPSNSLDAQQRDQTTSSTRSADESTIRSLEERERSAVLRQDFDELERLWSADYTVNSPMNRIAPDRAAVLEIFRRGLAQYSSFDRRIEEIRFHGDIAIVMGAETVEPTGQAPLAGQTVERRFTNIWKREGDTWRMVARHANNIARPEAAARDGEPAERAIMAILEAHEDRWNRHDMAGWAEILHQDADWVHWRGGYWRGKAEIKAGHEAIHGTFYKASRVSPQRIEDLTFLTPEIALAHVRSELTGDERAPGETFAYRKTILFTQQDGIWRIRALHNTRLQGVD